MLAITFVLIYKTRFGDFQKLCRKRIKLHTCIMARGGTPPLATELERLYSFVHWPETAQAYPTRLAKAGLYYTGISDTVACFCCGIHISEWQYSDQPLEEHRRHSPSCAFVCGKPNANVPLLPSSERFSAEGEQLIEISTSLGPAGGAISATDNRQGEALRATVTQTLEQQTSLPTPERHLDNSMEQLIDRFEILGNEPYSANTNELESRRSSMLTSFCGEGNETQTSPVPGTSMPSFEDTKQQRVESATDLLLSIPVLEGLTVYVPVEDTISLLPEAYHPEYAHINSRYESFRSWDYSTGQQPVKMAEAGFYYTGTDDRVCCYQCNGGLCNWQADDVPLYEHSRWFGACAYIQRCQDHPVAKAIIDTASRINARQSYSHHVQCDK